MTPAAIDAHPVGPVARSLHSPKFVSPFECWKAWKHGQQESIPAACVPGSDVLGDPTWPFLGVAYYHVTSTMVPRR